MTSDVNVEQFRRVLDALDADLPSALEVAEALADATGRSTDDAQAEVYDAIDAGVLVEDGEGWGGVRLAGEYRDCDETPETEDTGERKAEEAETCDETPTPSAEKPASNSRDDAALAAFEAAVDYCHAQLDREADLPGDADTPREYFREVRGWEDATIDEKRLGWAPARWMDLLDYLIGEGFDREAILGTGLFWENGLAPIWQGRLIFPYLVDERPAFAISRRVGDEGHEADSAGVYADDDASAKYHKIPNQDCTLVEEPIYGVDSLEADEDALITEGIADAITAHEAGYACLSPVTTTFNHDDRERLLRLLDDRDVGRVVVVQDAEHPTSDLSDERDGWDDLHVEQYGEGLKGAVRTAGYLANHDVNARVGELPQPGIEKVDLNDYLGGWADTLALVVASAAPAEQHPAFDADGHTGGSDDTPVEKAGTSTSALFDLKLTDVASVSAGERTTNPLGHHGDSENYYVVADDGETAYEYKYKVTYNALTHLLVEARERRADSPEGDLSDRGDGAPGDGQNHWHRQNGAR